jgi:hypothetical protein
MGIVLCGGEIVAARFLFRVKLLLFEDFVRRPKFVFDLCAFLNLANSFEHDLVTRIKPAFDDKNVLEFVLDRDLSLMHDIFFVDDPHVSLVEQVKRRPLGN